ncbi:MAG TPA: LCP family protein [Polyangiaceae bacterium]|jgi:LCP family protein required for cell wall assembly
MSKRWRWGVPLSLLVLLVNWLLAAPYRAHGTSARRAGVTLRQRAPRAFSERGASALVALASPGTPSAIDAPPTQHDTAKSDTPPLEYTDNYLLVGLDRRPFGGGAGLSDTIVVAVFDEPSSALGLVSVPRDLWVEIPGHDSDRINTVMNVARRSGQDPLDLLARVIENTLELPVSHVLAIDIGVLERAVDALGGVTVDVPCPLIDRFVDPRDPSGYRRLDVAAGAVRMDGLTAAMYVRSRHGRSDFSRARRQQALLMAMRHELLATGSLLKLPALLAEFDGAFETDMRRIEMLELIARLKRVPPSRIHGLVLDTEQLRGRITPEGKAVLDANRGATIAALTKLFSAAAPGGPPALAACPKADIALGASSG